MRIKSTVPVRRPAVAKGGGLPAKGCQNENHGKALANPSIARKPAANSPRGRKSKPKPSRKVGEPGVRKDRALSEIREQ